MDFSDIVETTSRKGKMANEGECSGHRCVSLRKRLQWAVTAEIEEGEIQRLLKRQNARQGSMILGCKIKGKGSRFLG